MHRYLGSQASGFLSPALLGLPLSVLDNTQFSAFPAAHGVTSNFDNPVSQRKALVAIDILSITLMLVFVGMRLFAKHYIVPSLGWGDCESRTVLSTSKLIIDRYMHYCGSEWRGTAAPCLC